MSGDRIGSPGLAEAADLAREAALAAGTAGRTLAAANADLPWPRAPHLILWQAINVLREPRLERAGMVGRPGAAGGPRVDGYRRPRHRTRPQRPR
jgi:hypothetical protein